MELPFVGSFIVKTGIAAISFNEDLMEETRGHSRGETGEALSMVYAHYRAESSTKKWRSSHEAVSPV